MTYNKQDHDYLLLFLVLILKTIHKYQSVLLTLIMGRIQG